MQIKSIWNGPAYLGECPVWHPDTQQLYWVDCAKGQLHHYDPLSQQVASWKLPAPIGCIAPVKGKGLLGFMQGEVIYIDTDDGSHRKLATVFAKDAAMRVNDGKCDRQGRFWMGTATTDFEHAAGCLFCFDQQGKIKKMGEGLFISNGLGWSPDDQWMYHCDSWLGTIYRYRFDAASGDLGEREQWFTYPGLGVPDGLTVDADGYIWTAVWDGSKILRIDPQAKVCQEIWMPVQRPTSCIFGGEELQTLFVSSCSRDVQETESLPAPNGAVYAIDRLHESTHVSAQKQASVSAIKGLAEGSYQLDE